jgi:hypothetical protein
MIAAITDAGVEMAACADYLMYRVPEGCADTDLMAVLETCGPRLAYHLTGGELNVITRGILDRSAACRYQLPPNRKGWREAWAKGWIAKFYELADKHGVEQLVAAEFADVFQRAAFTKYYYRGAQPLPDMSHWVVVLPRPADPERIWLSMASPDNFSATMASVCAPGPHVLPASKRRGRRRPAGTHREVSGGRAGL